MTFFNPLAWWFLILVPLLLLLYLPRRPKDVRWVANLYLWQQSLTPRTFHLSVTRFRSNWLMLLHLLFLLTGILALTRPALTWPALQPRSYVFLFDASASMQTVEHGHSRFAKAREAAVALLDSLKAGDRVMLMQARARPGMVSDFLTDTQLLRQLIENLSPTDAVADIPAALLLALATAESTADVYIFSDGAANAVLPEALRLARVHYVQVGAPAENVAITRLEVRRNPLSPTDQEVYAELMNFSQRAHAIEVRLTADDTPLKVATVTLGPGERHTMVTAYVGAGPTVIAARLITDDAFAVDNQAYALAVPPPRLSVLLVSDDNFFVERALTVHPWVHLTRMSRETYIRQPVHQGFDVVVCDGLEPHEGVPGNYIVINVQSTASLPVTQAPVPYPTLSSPHPQHPLLAFINVENIVISETRPLPVPAGGTVLLEADNKPILVVSTGAERRVVTLGFDPAAAQLPLTVTFPILMANILHWLTPEQSHERLQLRPGEPLHWSIPASLGLTTVTITPPHGRTVTKAVAKQELIFDDTTTVGVYTMRGGNYDKKFVVNLFDEPESTLQPVFFSTTAAPTRLGQMTVHQDYVELWPYLLWAALLLLMVEWWLASRRALL